MTSSKVTVSTDTFSVFSPIFFLTRCCCFLPVKFNRTGRNTSISWSWKYYGVSLAAFIVTMAWLVFGLVKSYAIEDVYKIRLSELSGKFITILDDTYLLLTFTLAALITPVTFRHFSTYLRCLSKVDHLLKQSISPERRKCCVVLLTTLTLTLVILGLDMATWWNHVFNRHVSIGLYLLYNLAFYYTFFIVMVIEMNYWYLVQMINVRLASLNDHLKSEYNEVKANGVNNKASQRSSVDVANNVNITKSPAVGGGVCSSFVLDLYIRNISKYVKVYEHLFEASEAVNRFYGLNILLVTIGCLIHLLVTPYDLYLELKFKDYTFIFPQICWMVSHVLRLLLFVEPCHIATQRVKVASSMVCQFLSLDIPDGLHCQLQTLAIQLFHCPIQFTAYDLVVLDRSLLTKIAGGVTTYLVILFQFEN